MQPQISLADKQRIQKLWADAAGLVPPPAAASTAQALAFGLNFRVNLIQGFQAAWETTMLVAKAKAAAMTPYDVFAWLEVGKDFISAVTSIFSTLIERMAPIDYVTAVILSVQSAPPSDVDAQKAVEAYLNDPASVQLAAYLGMSSERINRAKEVASANGWFGPVIARMIQEGHAKRDAQGKLTFETKNFEIGWKQN